MIDPAPWLRHPPYFPAVALANYYLHGYGKNITQVIADTTGLDVDTLLAEATSTVGSVQALVRPGCWHLPAHQRRWGVAGPAGMRAGQ